MLLRLARVRRSRGAARPEDSTSQKPPFGPYPPGGGYLSTAGRAPLDGFSGRVIAFAADPGLQGSIAPKGERPTGCNRSGVQRCNNTVGQWNRNDTAVPASRIYRKQRIAASLCWRLGTCRARSSVSLFPSAPSRHEQPPIPGCELLRQLQRLLGISATDRPHYRMQCANGPARAYTSTGPGTTAVRAREAW